VVDGVEKTAQRLLSAGKLIDSAAGCLFYLTHIFKGIEEE